ncbi:MAG: exodeoxyribonuclease VII small subunit [Fidelibacterota bacterium]
MAKTTKVLTFEEAGARLEEIVTRLESETISLEESLNLFEEGMKLTQLCRSQLEAAEARIRTLVRRDSGELEAAEEG